jgi:AcrR family transcriptional regulator
MPTMPAGDDARAAMVDAAERLMAERGMGAVSMREVLEASNQRNKSAAQYHFGSRDGLISAIVEARMGPINAARIDMLDQLDAAARPLEVRDFVTALIEPLADATVRRPGSHYGRFLAQSHADPSWSGAVEESQHGSGYRRWREGLLGCFEHLPAGLRSARIDRMVTMVIITLGRWEGAGGRGRVPLEARVQDLVDTAVAVIEAPVSATTALLLEQPKNARPKRKRST